MPRKFLAETSFPTLLTGGRRVGSAAFGCPAHDFAVTRDVLELQKHNIPPYAMTLLGRTSPSTVALRFVQVLAQQAKCTHGDTQMLTCTQYSLPHDLSIQRMAVRMDPAYKEGYYKDGTSGPPPLHPLLGLYDQR